MNKGKEQGVKLKKRARVRETIKRLQRNKNEHEHKKEHDSQALEQGGWELKSDTLLGGKTAFTRIRKDGMEKRQERT